MLSAWLKRPGWIFLHLPWWLSTLKQPARPASTVNHSLKFMKFLWGSIQGGGGGRSVWGLQGLGMGERAVMIDPNLHFESHSLFYSFRMVRRSAFWFFRQLRCNAFPCAAAFLTWGQRGDGWVEIDDTQQGGLQTFVNKPDLRPCSDRLERENKTLPHVAPLCTCKCLPPKE